MADDSDGEGDPSEDASDGDDSCGHPSVVEDDDDSNCEGMCEAPCCFDDDEDDDSDYDGDGEEEEEESEEALSDGDDDVQGEEVCDEEDSVHEFIGDPFDEDGEEGDGEAEDLCEDPSSDDGEEGEPEADDSLISDSVQDEFSSSEDDDPRGGAAGSNRGGEGLTPVALPTRSMPVPLTVHGVQMLIHFVHTDSDSDADSDSGDTDLPASRAVVESLPEAALSEEEAACGCAVCKDVFASGQRVVSLPCKHYFHTDCIRPWLAIRSTCPVCRYQLPTDDAESRQRQERELMVLL